MTSAPTGDKAWFDRSGAPDAGAGFVSLVFLSLWGAGRKSPATAQAAGGWLLDVDFAAVLGAARGLQRRARRP